MIERERQTYRQTQEMNKLNGIKETKRFLKEGRIILRDNLYLYETTNYFIFV